MKIEIKNRWTGALIFGGDFKSLKACVEHAVSLQVNLSGSDLRGSNLRDSNLRGSDLRGSNLRGSDLRDSDLRGSNLRDSDLRGSDLRGSDLRDSDLRGSDLRGSDLRGSNLRGSDLSGSDLRGSDLRDSDLSGSNLRGSDLRGSNLRGSDLSDIRNDFLAEVLKLPNELEFLRQALMAGKVDGTTYKGECACLAGTMAHAKGIQDYDGTPIRNGLTFRADTSSPRERFFLAIREGDTPENNSACKIALEWTDEAIAIRDNIRAFISISK
jgi:uncharacterized protein YjbI with pentapeptide repeats